MMDAEEGRRYEPYDGAGAASRVYTAAPAPLTDATRPEEAAWVARAVRLLDEMRPPQGGRVEFVARIADCVGLCSGGLYQLDGRLVRVLAVLADDYETVRVECYPEIEPSAPGE